VVWLTEWWGHPENDNFPWVLLDRVSHHYREIASRLHSRRGQQIQEFFKN